MKPPLVADIRVTNVGVAICVAMRVAMRVAMCVAMCVAMDTFSVIHVCVSLSPAAVRQKDRLQRHP